MGRLASVLGGSWGVLGSSWGALGRLLGAFWSHLGGLLELKRDLGSILEAIILNYEKQLKTHGIAKINVRRTKNHAKLKQKSTQKAFLEQNTAEIDLKYNF